MQCIGRALGVGGCDKISKEIRGPWFQSMVSIARRAYCPCGISEAEKTGRKGWGTIIAPRPYPQGLTSTALPPEVPAPPKTMLSI